MCWHSTNMRDEICFLLLDTDGYIEMCQRNACWFLLPNLLAVFGKIVAKLLAYLYKMKSETIIGKIQTGSSAKNGKEEKYSPAISSTKIFFEFSITQENEILMQFW